MAYYLSYIELWSTSSSSFARHSAMILSRQMHPSEPSEIHHQLGFTDDPHKKNVHSCSVGALYDLLARFRMNQPGYLGHEHIASAVLYSTSLKVKHVTYEISESEKKELDNILNDQLDRPPLYNMFTHNCKTYALNLFKKIGIDDIERFHNFCVDIPLLDNKLLSNIKKHDLFCSRGREESINIVKDNINLLDNFSNIDGLTQHESSRIQTLVAKIKNEMPSQNDFDRHSCFSPNLKKQFDLLQVLSEIIIISNISEKEKFIKIINKIKDHNQHIINSAFTFLWHTTPPLTRRVNLANFKPQEKALYFVRIKENEINYGLDYLLEYLRADKSKDEALNEDKLEFIKLINNAKEQIKECNTLFYQNLKEEKTDFKDVCSKQVEDLDQIIVNLQKDITTYIPKATNQSSVFINLINSILSYLKKDYFVVDHTTKNGILNKINHVNDSTKNYYQKMGFLATLSTKQQEKKSDIAEEKSVVVGTLLNKAGLC